MKTKSILFFLIGMMLSALNVSAQSLEKMSNQELLNRLDEVIVHKMEYRDTYIARIDSMKRCAGIQSLPVRAATYQSIFQAYSKLQSDSAMAYLMKMESLPMMHEDAEYALRVKIGRAEVFGIMGLYSSAVRALHELNVTASSQPVRLYYYQVCRTVYGWMADYGEVADQMGHYRDLTQLYRDSIISVQESGINRSIVEADRYFVIGDLAKAQSITNSCLSKADPLQHCYLYINLADIAHAQGRTEDEIRYLAMTAISDLQRGITEYSALAKLAVILSEEGDSERAYDYLICTMDDAGYCKARLRTLEATSVFPIIERAHHAKMQERTHWHIGFSCAFALFALFLIGGVVYLKRQNRRLADTRQQLADSIRDQQMVNDTLQQVNEQLLQSNKAKEMYVVRYLERCRGYIDTIDERRKQYLRLLRNKEYDALQKLLKSTNSITEEEANFYSDFDEAFLTLYPDFITHFNALLQPDTQIVTKHEELLNTELRIFALIRLGISDSNRIAHFLNYSLPTIYSYRSRLRNKSIFSKEEFDVKVMEC